MKIKIVDSGESGIYTSGLEKHYNIIDVETGKVVKERSTEAGIKSQLWGIAHKEINIDKGWW